MLGIHWPYSNCNPPFVRQNKRSCTLCNGHKCFQKTLKKAQWPKKALDPSKSHHFETETCGPQCFWVYGSTDFAVPCTICRSIYSELCEATQSYHKSDTCYKCDFAGIRANQNLSIQKLKMEISFENLQNLIFWDLKSGLWNDLFTLIFNQMV